MPLKLAWTRFDGLSVCQDNVTAYQQNVGQGWDGYEWVVKLNNKLNNKDNRPIGCTPQLPSSTPMSPSARSTHNMGKQEGGCKKVPAGWTARVRTQKRGDLLAVEYSAPPSSKQAGDSVLVAKVRLCETGTLIDSGAHRFVSLARPRKRLQPSPSASQTTLPCNEEYEFRSLCFGAARSYRAHLRDTEFKRGLFFELAGYNKWGIGNLLAVAYLVHSWCLKAHRFCYLKLFDSDLETIFGYRDGRAWAPATHALQRYAWNRTFKRRGGDRKIVRQASLSHIHDLIMSESNQDVPLLHVQMPTLYSDWFSSDIFLQTLDHCANRFVTEPRVPMPVLAGVPTHVFHFRTWFADVPDDDTRREKANRAETRRWFDGSKCNATLFSALGARGVVLSDSPGWSEWMQAAFGLQGVPQPGGQASRSWNVSFAVKLAAAVDVHIASLARELFVGGQSRFPSVALARSVCAHGVSDLTAACPNFELLLPRNFPNYVDLKAYGINSSMERAIADGIIQDVSSLPNTIDPVTKSTIQGTMSFVSNRLRPMWQTFPRAHPCTGPTMAPMGYRGAVSCYRRYLQAFSTGR
jgi:hypothetical protein